MPSTFYCTTSGKSNTSGKADNHLYVILYNFLSILKLITERDVLHMQDIKLNLEEFEELVQPQPPGTGPCINIHSSGNISLNAKLLEKLHTRELRVLVSHDREMILLDEKGESTFRFPKGGSVKAVDFTRSLVEQGISLPARYEVIWSEKNQLWMGTWQRPLKAPDPAKLAQKLGGRTRRKAAK